MKRDLPRRTFEFSKGVVQLCLVLDEQPGVSRTLARQLLRSGTSIGANVEEAQASRSEADFTNKISIACKEARETRYWLRLLEESDLAKQKQLVALEKECNELIAILTTIVRKMRRKLE